MAIQVRIPTPLRKLTGGAESVAASGATIAAVVQDLEIAASRAERAHLRRRRQGPPLRQRVRQRRRHPLSRQSRDAGEGRRRDLDRSRDRRRPLPDRERFDAASGGDAACGSRTSLEPGRQHAARADPRARARSARGRARVREARGLQPGRLGEGPSRLQHDPGRPRERNAASRQDDPRLDVGQHRHRARDGRRRARLSGRAGHARERQHRAQEDHRRVRRQGDLLERRSRAPTAPSGSAARC